MLDKLVGCISERNTKMNIQNAGRDRQLNKTVIADLPLNISRPNSTESYNK